MNTLLRSKGIIRVAYQLGLLVVLMGATLTIQQAAFASPYGEGTYNADVPYGSATTLSISLSGAVDFILAPSSNTFSGSGSHTVTVSSTDVVGYQLFINSTTPTTAMSNGTSSIAASANTSASALSVNTWGYNTTGSTSNFIGITPSAVLLKSATGPYKDGDATTVTYGAYADNTKTSGTYTVDVTYTAAGES